VVGGGAGAHAYDHAGLDVLQGRPGRGSFLLILVHGFITTMPATDLSSGIVRGLIEFV